MQNYIIGTISSISNDFKHHVDGEWKKKIYSELLSVNPSRKQE